MAEAPWTKLYHEEFLQGVSLANLTPEEIGVYAVILFLIAARGGPIEDDRRWIAGRCNCPSVRKCGMIIDRLLDTGKLERRGKLLGNAKMIRVVEERDAKSTQARRAALARWHGDEAQLPLDEPPQPPSRARAHGAARSRDYPAIYPPEKPEDKSEINAPIKQRKRQKPAVQTDADACFPRARAPVRSLDIQNTPQPDSSTSEVTTRASAADVTGRAEGETIPLVRQPDLMDLYDQVTQACGFTPSAPGQIDRALKVVEGWKKDGIDFDVVVLPVVRNTIANSSDPTRTLGRFDKAVRHEHARSANSSLNGRPYRAPAAPDLAPQGEDERFRPLRAELLKRLGPVAYARYCNRVRFSAVPDAGKGRKPMRVKDPMSGGLGLMDADRATIVRAAAERLGFTDVW